MPRINEDLRVGLRIVQILKKEKAALTSKDLAKKLGSTKLFVIKVAQDLVRANILFSSRGALGGFVVDESRKITALEVAQALGYQIRDYKESHSDMIDYKIALSFYKILRETIIK